MTTQKKIPTNELAEHILWMFAERFGLIDSVGGMEWASRTEGTELASPEWVERHDKLSSLLSRTPNAYTNDPLALAIIHHVFDEDAAP